MLRRGAYSSIMGTVEECLTKYHSVFPHIYKLKRYYGARFYKKVGLIYFYEVKIMISSNKWMLLSVLNVVLFRLSVNNAIKGMFLL